MTSSPARILGIGNALTDIIIQLKNDHQLEELALPKGSMQLVDKSRADQILNYFSEAPKDYASGGSASNTLYGLARLGAQAGFIGSLGQNDPYRDIFQGDMVKSGIEGIVFTGQAGSGTAITLMSPDSERTFATYLGAALELSAEQLKAEYFEGYQYFHIEGYLVQNYDLVRKAMELAHQAGLQISLDLASYNVVEENLPFLQEIVKKYVDTLFANEEEAKAFTGKAPEEALGVLAQYARYAVVKIGAKGSLIQSGDRKIRIAPTAVVCKDANGAGDGYAAGFLYGLMNDYSLEEAGNLGAKVAAEVVQVMGPRLAPHLWTDLRNQK